jgi:hypothetical protein
MRRKIKTRIKRPRKKVFLKEIHTPSIGEIRIAKWLKDNKITNIPEAIFSDCVNPKTGQNLIFDFYVPVLNICIEYQGSQHTEYTKKFHGPKRLQKFEKQVAKDEIKKKFCKAKGFKLLEIFYTDWENIEKILEDKLIKKN